MRVLWDLKMTAGMRTGRLWIIRERKMILIILCEIKCRWSHMLYVVLSVIDQVMGRLRWWYVLECLSSRLNIFLKLRHLQSAFRYLEYFSEAVVQRSSAKKLFLEISFTGKHLRISFLMKLLAWGLQLYWKRDSCAGVFTELFLQNFSGRLLLYVILK